MMNSLGTPTWIKSPRCETCASWTSEPTRVNPSGLWGPCAKMTAIVDNQTKNAATKNTWWCKDFESSNP